MRETVIRSIGALRKMTVDELRAKWFEDASWVRQLP